MGDPGVIHDADTAPSDLPAYEGPPDPPAGHTHEWGADVVAEAGLPEFGLRRWVSRWLTPAGRRRKPSRSRASGTVAAAIPPTTSATPRSWLDDGVSPSRTIARPIDMTGWVSRMTEVMIAGSRATRSRSAGSPRTAR